MRHSRFPLGFLFLWLVPLVALSVGCDSRSLGADRDGSMRPDRDGSMRPDRDGSMQPDRDGSMRPDGAEPPLACTPQDVGTCPDPCGAVVGYFWDGAACAPIVCCCEGPDCAETYATAEACAAAHVLCTDNACVAAAGYCEYGDYVLPTCREGYGQFGQVERDHPGVCDLGVCCTLCLAPGDEVSYISRDPAECASIDWDCASPGATPFDNECGCGCFMQ